MWIDYRDQLVPPNTIHPILYSLSHPIKAFNQIENAKHFENKGFQQPGKAYCMAPSRWVFATVERIFRWNHFSGGRGLAAEHDGWGPRNDPQKGGYASWATVDPNPIDL